MRFFLYSFTLAVAAVATALPHGPDDDNDASVATPIPSTAQYTTTAVSPTVMTYGALPHLSIADFRMPHPTPKPIAKAQADTVAECTTTILRPVSFNNLTVCTDYKRTKTHTEKIDCGSCTAVATRGLGPGPVVRCLTRTTVEVKTETVLACRK